MPWSPIAAQKNQKKVTAPTKTTMSVHTLGDRVLRQPAKRVAKVNDEIRQIVQDMLQTMYDEDGIGLAAPQVGVHKRIIVIDLEPNDPKTEPMVMINPEITQHSRQMLTFEEGCLSIPDVFLEVQRYQAIVVNYRDERGRPREIKAEGMLACVLQHEIDHLDGVLFVDRVKNEIKLQQELKARGFNPRDVSPYKSAQASQA